MADVETSLKDLMRTNGAIAVALVDYDSGMALGTAGTGLDMEIAAAGNSEVIKTKLRVAEALGINEMVEDILITLETQYHLLRLVRSQRGRGLFFYLALDKSQANLAMARRELSNVESALEI